MKDTLHDPAETKLQRDFFFDPACEPTTRAGKQAVVLLREAYLQAEAADEPRDRQRKQKDFEILELQLGAVLGNLATASLRRHPTPVAIPRSKKVLGSKSTHRVYGDTFPRVIDVLKSAGLLYATPGSYEARKLTTIEPTAKLFELCRVQRKDFQYNEREPIVLRAKKTADTQKRKLSGKELPVPDTIEVRRMKDEVQRFNDFLTRQDIRYQGPRTDVDDERRTTHRVFNNGKLTDGGRLYGGFWQSLSGAKDGKPDERLDIAINGERLVGLDYGQIAIRILYSLEGCQPKMDDCYVLDGWGVQSRDGMKKLINTMINDPTGSANVARHLFGSKSRDYKSAEELNRAAKEAILHQHALIADHFNGRSTYRLLFEESNLLMSLLMELMDRDIPALPIHDCLYVRSSDAGTVRELMRERFVERFNVLIDVN